MLLLGTGSDTAIWRPGDGSDTIEGQEGGNDTLDFQGANVNERIEISPNGNRVRLTRDVANIVMDLNGVEQIGISARGGTDLVVVDDLAGTDVKGVTVDLEGVIGGGTGDGAGRLRRRERNPREGQDASQGGLARRRIGQAQERNRAHRACGADGRPDGERTRRRRQDPRDAECLVRDHAHDQPELTGEV